MNINKEIESYLNQKRNEAIKDFKKIETPHPIFTEIFGELENINEEEAKSNLVRELKKNCEEYWTNTNEGFNSEEKIRVLLFEYYNFDCGFDCLTLDAMAYGIYGEGFKIKSEYYDYGYDYDFVSSMENTYGVTFDTFAPLAKLGDEIYKDIEFIDEEGYIDLRHAYVWTTYMIFQKAIKEFVKSEEFKKLSVENILHIMIGEHDYDTQPIFYVYSSEEEIKEAIKLQEEDT